MALETVFRTGERPPGELLLPERITTPCNGEEYEGEREEDNFEKTFASGTIVTHFLASDAERRRWRGVRVADFNFVADAVAAALGEGVQEVHGAGDLDGPESDSAIFAVRMGTGTGRGVAAAVCEGHTVTRWREDLSSS
jgi:hypothetical protein